MSKKSARKSRKSNTKTPRRCTSEMLVAQPQTDAGICDILDTVDDDRIIMMVLVGAAPDDAQLEAIEAGVILMTTDRETIRKVLVAGGHNPETDVNSILIDVGRLKRILRAA